MKQLKCFGLLIPVSLSLFGCSAESEGETLAQVQQATTSTPRVLHVVAVTTGGGIRHAARTDTATGSTWTAFGDIEGQAGEIGTISDAEAVESEGGTHVVAIAGGTLFHTIRDTNGAWTGFGNVNSVLGSVGTHTSVGLSAGAARTHLCTTTSTGGLFHAIRFADGSWSGWNNVKTLSGTNPGSFTRVDCSAQVFITIGPGGSVQDELQLVGTTSNGQIWHATRTNNGAWSALGNVNVATGSSATFLDVDASYGSNDLQIVGTGANLQQHAIRFFNGSWQAFGSIAAQAGDPGDERHSSTVSLDDGLHVLVVTADGGLFNTLRLNSGAWQAYVNVKTATGSSENFSRVSVAGVPSVVQPD
jgi:hypothetical protein